MSAVAGTTISSRYALNHLRSVTSDESWTIETHLDGMRLKLNGKALSEDYYLDIHHSPRTNTIVGVLTNDGDKCQILVDGYNGMPVRKRNKIGYVSCANSYQGYDPVVDIGYVSCANSYQGYDSVSRNDQTVSSAAFVSQEDNLGSLLASYQEGGGGSLLDDDDIDESDDMCPTASSRDALTHLRSISSHESWSMEVKPNGIRLLHKGTPLSEDFYLDIHHARQTNIILGVLTPDGDNCQILVDGYNGTPVPKRAGIGNVSCVNTYTGYDPFEKPVIVTYPIVADTDDSVRDRKPFEQTPKQIDKPKLLIPTCGKMEDVSFEEKALNVTGANQDGQEKHEKWTETWKLLLTPNKEKLPLLTDEVVSVLLAKECVNMCPGRSLPAALCGAEVGLGEDECDTTKDISTESSRGQKGTLVQTRADSIISSSMLNGGCGRLDDCVTSFRNLRSDEVENRNDIELKRDGYEAEHDGLSTVTMSQLMADFEVKWDGDEAEQDGFSAITMSQYLADIDKRREKGETIECCYMAPQKLQRKQSKIFDRFRPDRQSKKSLKKESTTTKLQKRLDRIYNREQKIRNIDLKLGMLNV